MPIESASTLSWSDRRKLAQGCAPARRGLIRVSGREIGGPAASNGADFQSYLPMAWRSTVENMLQRLGIRGLRAGGCRETAQESIQPVALDTGGDVFTFTASFGGDEQFAPTRAPIYGMELVRRAVLGLDSLT